jgi:hypothetical protein
VPAVGLGRAVVMFSVTAGMTVLFLFTFKAVIFISGTVFPMLRFDTFAIRARVRVMVNFTWIFRLIRVEWIYLCHACSTSNFAAMSTAKNKYLFPPLGPRK